MNKKIEDYLPYYIGQELASKATGDIVGTLFGVIGKEVRFKISGVVHGDNSNYYMLLLRPLSSMTEEEIVELFKTVSLFDLSECSFDVVNIPNERWANAEYNGRVIDSIKIIGDNVEMMNNDGTFSTINTASTVFHYLLKQGFDLFGLIEAGLAIDKTKEVTDGAQAN